MFPLPVQTCRFHYRDFKPPLRQLPYRRVRSADVTLVVGAQTCTSAGGPRAGHYGHDGDLAVDLVSPGAHWRALACRSSGMVPGRPWGRCQPSRIELGLQRSSIFFRAIPPTPRVLHKRVKRLKTKDWRCEK
jgi:hypothetical protein